MYNQCIHVWPILGTSGCMQIFGSKSQPALGLADSLGPITGQVICVLGGPYVEYIKARLPLLKPSASLLLDASVNAGEATEL